MNKIGYIRVSTKDQNPERQIIAMREYGILQKNIYLDKMSGQNFDRPEYSRMLMKLKKGDLLVIKSIDRLGRNYNEILEQWRIITKEKETDIEVIDMPLLNTHMYDNKDLTGLFISDLVLQILAYVAETERAFIKQRQAEGIAAAKAKGIKFGTRRKDVPKEFYEYFNLWEEGQISIRKAAEKVSMSPATFYRRCKELKENKS
jgi:DNA invertase Pin-like site-specific DNA recombinase